jgi:hypothetical protein
MTAGVWMVPVVLLAAVVFLWASAWFESHVAPRDSHPQLPTLQAVDTAFVDTAPDGTPLDMDAPLAGEPARRVA